MIEKTDAIVLHSIKYGDTSLIATCYTKERGIKTYIIKGVLKHSKTSKFRPAYFQPLTQVCITANHKDSNTLHTIREIEISHFYESIFTDIKKQTISLFLAEILYYSIKEEEPNHRLYQYLETSFLWLDSHDTVANFHLIFLMNLTKYLGFYPVQQHRELPYFDLLEGRFTSQLTNHCIKDENLELLIVLLGTNFDEINSIKLNSNQRQTIVKLLLDFFELHISGFKTPKSLEVLKAVFN